MGLDLCTSFPSPIGSPTALFGASESYWLLLWEEDFVKTGYSERVPAFRFSREGELHVGACLPEAGIQEHRPPAPPPPHSAVTKPGPFPCIRGLLASCLIL